MAQQRPEGSCTVQFYKEYRLDAKGNQLFICEYCRQKLKSDFIEYHVRMICHMYEKHGKSEIIEDPKYQSVAARFNLHRQGKGKIDIGKCLVSNCEVEIKSKFGQALPFKNHLITHHTDDKKSFFAKAVEIDSGQKILNNYIIEDTEYAKCSFCRTLIPLEGLDSHTAGILAALSRHLIPHIKYFLDEASIQSELKKEEEMQLIVNQQKQNIDKEIGMEETLRNIETGAASEDLNTLLQRYRMKLNKELRRSGMIQKQGHWVPYELKPRDVERRFGTCELLLQRQKRKGFLTITGDRYRLQLMRLSRALKEKRPLYAQRHDKVILLHDNARPHVAKPIKTYIAPSDCHLFRSMAHGLADRRFHSYEEAQKWIDSWIASKDMSFFRRGIHVLPERWSKVVESDGKYFH
ncbi:MOS1T transposase, partial [Pseudoatta argentina]